MLNVDYKMIIVVSGDRTKLSASRISVAFFLIFRVIRGSSLLQLELTDKETEATEGRGGWTG